MIRKLALLVVLTMFAFAGLLGLLLTSGGQGGPTVEVVVPAGSSTGAIANLLRSTGVSSNPTVLRLAAKIKGLDGRLQAGRYLLREGMGAFEVLALLAKGPVDKTVSVTIPEGFNVNQINARLVARGQLNLAELQKASTDGSVRSALMPADVLIPEGFLFPETYAVGERDSAIEVLRRMVGSFDTASANFDWAVPQAAGLSKYQAVIVASIIEREAKLPEDRPKVAAVIYNRLRKGMRLQIDITALYGREHKVPTRKDLKVASPYNTYLNDGLPPTPISNPGMASLQAALHPASINAIYYVVVDPSGRHAFADNDAEFQRLKRSCPKANCG